MGVETEPDDAPNAEDSLEKPDINDAAGSSDTSDDFEVTSPDVRHPSTIGISFCVRLHEDGCVVIRLPESRQFFLEFKERLKATFRQIDI